MSAAHERTVQVDGVRIQLREVGEGAPVLLVNGLGAHTAMWRVLERSLHGLRLIEFDAPGAGRSGTPAIPHRIRGLARIAAGVLDAAGVEQADVLGYSMGGIVAQQLALDSPDRVRRLVLGASGCGIGSVPSSTAAMLNILTPLRFVSRRYYDWTIGSMVGGRARHDRAWVAEHGALRLQQAPAARGYFGQLVSIGGWTSLPHLARITHPTLVVGGEDDPLSPSANVLLLAHRLPRARALLAPGEGHLLLMDADSVVHEPIRRFLAAPSLRREPVWTHGWDITAEDVRRAMPPLWRQTHPFGIISSAARRAWAH